MLEQFEPFWSDFEITWQEHMTPKVALRYHEQLLGALPRKVEYLTRILLDNGVGLTGDGRHNFVAAADWLGRNARKTKLGEAGLAQRRRQLEGVPREIVEMIGDKDLDAPTFSMCRYVGYFFSESLRTACPHTRYMLFKGGSININHNKTVLVGANDWKLEPVNVVQNVCYCYVDGNGRWHFDTLGDLWDIWREGLSGERRTALER